MIDELKILEGMVGSLAELGLGFLIGYFLYKFALLGVSVYFIKKLFEFARVFITSNRLTKEESQIIKDGAAKAEAEAERVKHMYKILKEAKDNELRE